MNITNSYYVGVPDPTRGKGSLKLLLVHKGDDGRLKLKVDRDIPNDDPSSTYPVVQKKFETVKVTKNPTALDILLSHLDKSDEEVLKLLPLFKNVKKNTLFSFLATIIRNKRYGLYKDVFDMIYDNPIMFPENRREPHTEFTENGMFVYDHPLPMETALESSDYDLVTTISEYYSTSAQYISRSKNEDICRCFSYVRDQCGVINDKYRLTIWLMLIKHVDLNSLRFRELADPNSERNYQDAVPWLLRHLIKMLMEPDTNSASTAALPTLWPVAFEMAGKILSRLRITM